MPAAEESRHAGPKDKPKPIQHGSHEALMKMRAAAAAKHELLHQQTARTTKRKGGERMAGRRKPRGERKRQRGGRETPKENRLTKVRRYGQDLAANTESLHRQCKLAQENYISRQGSARLRGTDTRARRRKPKS